MTMLEDHVRPPIAFRSKVHLLKWGRRNQLLFKKLGRRNEQQVVCLVGSVTGENYLWPYSQVWARADYKYYRNACNFVLTKRHGFTVDSNTQDVDHAVSKSYLLRHWPDAWVNILYVDSTLNRSVGSMLEKTMPAPQRPVIEFNIQSLLKILFDKSENENLNTKNLTDYFYRAASRLILTSEDQKFQSHADSARLLLFEIWNEHFPGQMMEIPADTIPA